MRYITLLSTLTAATLAGCASSQTADVDDGPRTTTSTRVVGVQSAMEMRTSTTASQGVVVVDGSLANVWRLLTAAYDSIGIPITSSDPGRGILGNESFKVRRRLKDAPLTRYLDCGSTQGGPSAETYEILLNVMTQLQPTEGGVRATTSLQAQGKPVSLAGDYINCASTGRLEARIGQLIGGAPPR